MITAMQNASTTYVSIKPSLTTCEKAEECCERAREMQKDSLCSNDCQKLFQYLTSLQNRQIFYTFQEIESALIEVEQRKIESVMQRILELGCEREK